MIEKIISMPFFSIVIPVYNKELFVTKTLDAVLAQTFTDYEIILVNDGSTDQSFSLIKGYSDPRIRIVNQNNQGVSSARNNGILQSQATYICLLDADDFWKKNHLQSLFDMIQKFPQAGLYSQRYQIKWSEKYIQNLTYDREHTYEGVIDDFFGSSYKNRVVQTSAVCFPKEIWHELGGFDENISLGEDLDFWIRIALKYPVVVGNQVTVVYNMMQKNESLTKISLAHHRLPDFEKYAEEEKTYPSLKRLLDLYRTEYALHFHIAGNREKKDFYLKAIDPKHLSKKTAFLLKTPSYLLKCLLYGKRFAKRFGIDFSVYH